MDCVLNPKLFILPHAEIKSAGLQNLTYGSLTKKGIKTLVSTLSKYISAVHGLDLGCGDGELIYHLQRALPDSSWEGVEISGHRVSSQMRDVCIWQGDMLEENFRVYNVLHADNLCLEDSVAERLELKIIREFRGIYISYRKAEAMEFIKNSVYLGSTITETTWTNHPIHFYRI